MDINQASDKENRENCQSGTAVSTRDSQVTLDAWMTKQQELYRYYESLQLPSEVDVSQQRSGAITNVASVSFTGRNAQPSILNQESHNECAPNNDGHNHINSDDLSEANDDCPHDFICPISQCMMIDPVITVNGTTYERKFIEEWLQHHDTDPLTNEKLPSKMLITNRSLRSLIQDWVMKRS
jgi:hypothetical protein